MPIRPLLESDEGVFGPDDVKVIAAVFDDLLRSLQLVDRSDPAVTMVAKLTIEVETGRARSHPLARKGHEIDVDLGECVSLIFVTAPRPALRPVRQAAHSLWQSETSRFCTADRSFDPRGCAPLLRGRASARGR